MKLPEIKDEYVQSIATKPPVNFRPNEGVTQKDYEDAITAYFNTIIGPLYELSILEDPEIKQKQEELDILKNSKIKAVVPDSLQAAEASLK